MFSKFSPLQRIYLDCRQLGHYHYHQHIGLNDSIVAYYATSDGAEFPRVASSHFRALAPRNKKTRTQEEKASKRKETENITHTETNEKDKEGRK